MHLLTDRTDNRGKTDGQYYCSAPIAVLEQLMSDPDLSIKEVRGTLGMFVESSSYLEHRASMEVCVFCAVVFWEASEKSIEHFLGSVLADCELDYEFTWGLLLLPNYFRKFCRKLVERFALINFWEWDLIREPRLDLFKGMAAEGAVVLEIYSKSVMA